MPHGTERSAATTPLTCGSSDFRLLRVPDGEDGEPSGVAVVALPPGEPGDSVAVGAVIVVPPSPGWSVAGEQAPAAASTATHTTPRNTRPSGTNTGYGGPARRLMPPW